MARLWLVKLVCADALSAVVPLWCSDFGHTRAAAFSLSLHRLGFCAMDALLSNHVEQPAEHMRVFLHVCWLLWADRHCD